ncbi:MAG: hypothetical protein IJ618_08905 [Prevotella sp.]|nr:hypothetical protein [Prevotella sp.]
MRPHPAINIELKSVLPLLALPVTATSSPRGKQGFPKMRNRKCIGGSSLSRVMRSASSSRSSSVIECASTDCCTNLNTSSFILLSFVLRDHGLHGLKI